MSTTPSGKIALVTGTSSGIGLSASIQLAQQGFTVIATMRDTSKASGLEEKAREAGVSVVVQKLDVEDDASVSSCVEGIIRDYGKIDLLVNNAGAGYLGTMETTSIPELKRTMEINFYGVWRVTQAVFSHMRAAKTGRIITVTSVGGLIGQPFNEAYCAAKFAVEGMMESLAPVAKRLGITISLIEPGPVNTNFVASVIAVSPTATPEMQSVYGPMLNAYMEGTRERFAQIGQTPDQIGEVILTAATTETPHFRYTTSLVIEATVSRKYVDTTGDNFLAFFVASLGKE